MTICFKNIAQVLSEHSGAFVDISLMILIQISHLIRSNLERSAERSYIIYCICNVLLSNNLQAKILALKFLTLIIPDLNTIKDSDDLEQICEVIYYVIFKF